MKTKEPVECAFCGAHMHVNTLVGSVCLYCSVCGMTSPFASTVEQAVTYYLKATKKMGEAYEDYNCGV